MPFDRSPPKLTDSLVMTAIIFGIPAGIGGIAYAFDASDALSVGVALLLSQLFLFCMLTVKDGFIDVSKKWQSSGVAEFDDDAANIFTTWEKFKCPKSGGCRYVAFSNPKNPSKSTHIMMAIAMSPPKQGWTSTQHLASILRPGSNALLVARRHADKVDTFVCNCINNPRTVSVQKGRESFEVDFLGWTITVKSKTSLFYTGIPCKVSKPVPFPLWKPIQNPMPMFVEEVVLTEEDLYVQDSNV